MDEPSNWYRVFQERKFPDYIQIPLENILLDASLDGEEAYFKAGFACALIVEKLKAKMQEAVK